MTLIALGKLPNKYLFTTSSDIPFVVMSASAFNARMCL